MLAVVLSATRVLVGLYLGTLLLKQGTREDGI